MTEGEIQRLINACEDNTPIGKGTGLPLNFPYGTGMRASELCSLKLKDIDRGGGEKSLQEAKGTRKDVLTYVGGVRK